MLKIYGADLSTPSNKVRFVANAIGLEYEYQKVKLREGEHRKDWFLELNPSGKIPVIDDDGFVLFESGAIVRHLASKHASPLYSKDIVLRAIIDQWIDFITIHIGMAMNRVVFNRIFAPYAKVEVDQRSLDDGLKFLARFLPVVNNQIGVKEFLIEDELTLADITLLSVLDPCEVAEVDLSSFENIVRWRALLKKMDFYTHCYSDYGEILRSFSAQAK